jgi:hypothetical protein
MTRRSSNAVMVALFAGVIAGVFYFHVLRQRVWGLREGEATEQRARSEVIVPPITTATDAVAPAQIYWASADVAGQLDPVTVQISLSADPEQRSRQLIRELVERPPTVAQRTLPPNVILLAFYLLPDGTGIADFSDNISTEIPSGILSESAAVDSILRTLAANVSSLRRLKILIHGQSAETLAGHVDLTGFFDVPPAIGLPGEAAASATPSTQPSP